MPDKKKKEKDELLQIIRDIDEKDLENAVLSPEKRPRGIEAEFVSEAENDDQVVDAISDEKSVVEKDKLEEERKRVTEDLPGNEKSDSKSYLSELASDEVQDTGQQDDEPVQEPDSKMTLELSAPPQEPEISLETAIAERDEYKDKFLRKAAELENYIKRVRREKEELRDFTITEICLSLLPVADNFERALAATNSTTERLLAGLKIIYQQLFNALSEYGLETLSSQLGETFNPELHEAIFVEATDAHPEHTVIEEYLKGYTYKNIVLRPAKVRVAVSRASMEEAAEKEKEMESAASTEKEKYAEEKDEKEKRETLTGQENKEVNSESADSDTKNKNNAEK